MKKIILIIALTIVSVLTSKAQIIVPLTGPGGPNHYLKDLDNVRANFVGTWQYIDGDKEFILHIYNWDMANCGSWWGQGDYYTDEIIGNYIYKENGEEIINSTSFLPSLSNYQGHAPFLGYTTDGIQSSQRLTSIKDFGIQLINNNCESSYKNGQVKMTILNIGSGNALQAEFKIFEIPGVHIMYPCATSQSGFTMPTDMLLTKISDTPPPLD